MSQSYFEEVADKAIKATKGNEVLLASVSGESSDFIRFNHGLVRQGGSITQQELSITLVDGAKLTSGQVQVAADAELDDARVGQLMS